MKNTTLCYLEQDGCLLMLHRVKKVNDENQDKWIGVGGKLEDKESPEDCLLREVREETGLELERWRYRGLVTFVSDKWETEYMHLYTADRFSGEMKECDEGNLEWVPRAQVESLPLWEGDKIFLRMIADPETPFFSLKLVYEGDRLQAAALDGRPLELN
jgi:8-oxo-dGTP diphosphatase